MNVVITGASAGIGKALAETFAEHGHAIFVVARREARLVSLCRELGDRYRVAAYPLALDLTDRDAAEILFREAVGALHNVHVLINNAGMSPYQDFCELSSCDLRQILALNVQALTELCHRFIPHMVDHGEPSHVVNVGSVGGYAPLPCFSVYTGTKHYVRVFTNLLHHEYRGTNVRVSALHPGGTLTEFPELAGQRVRPWARKGMLTPERVAERAYPAILRGQRVIIPGGIDKLAVLVGKVLPFPWAIRIMTLVYSLSVTKTDPANRRRQEPL
jgi:uncharacterized protein